MVYYFDMFNEHDSSILLCNTEVYTFWEIFGCDCNAFVMDMFLMAIKRHLQAH